MRNIYIVAMMVLAAMASPASAKTTQSRHIVLQGEQAAIVIHQCMREAPLAIQDTWTPDAAVVEKLNAHLADITALTSSLCCGVGDRLTGLDRYYLQYAGLVIEDHRYIYINALPGKSAPDDWRDMAVMSCAADRDYWGVLYDPESGRFSDLAFNGEPDVGE